MSYEAELRAIGAMRKDSKISLAISAADEIKLLRDALEDAKLFAVLIESYSRDNCEIYRHELKSGADLSLKRISEALDS